MIANIFGSDTLIVLVVAVVVLFGGSQLPKLAKNVGSAGREFRRAQAEAELDHARTEAVAGLSLRARCSVRCGTAPRRVELPVRAQESRNPVFL